MQTANNEKYALPIALMTFVSNPLEPDKFFIELLKPIKPVMHI